VKKESILLGITGAFGSGKSTASDFFVKHGFTKIRLSSLLEDALQKQTNQANITRKMLQDLGNEWREKEGAAVLAKKALALIAEKQLDRVVIDGIRSMSEVETLCTNPNFCLLAVVADREKRLTRLEQNPRRERLDLKSFAQLDYRDLGVGEKETGLQTGMCIALADVFVINNGTVESFEKQLAQYIYEGIK
jgi:dephospho-CoA kinase